MANVVPIRFLSRSANGCKEKCIAVAAILQLLTMIASHRGPTSRSSRSMPSLRRRMHIHELEVGCHPSICSP